MFAIVNQTKSLTVRQIFIYRRGSFVNKPFTGLNHSPYSNIRKTFTYTFLGTKRRNTAGHRLATTVFTNNINKESFQSNSPKVTANPTYGYIE